jgi:hypothetical protein
MAKVTQIYVAAFMCADWEGVHRRGEHAQTRK